MAFLASIQHLRVPTLNLAKHIYFGLAAGKGWLSYTQTSTCVCHILPQHLKKGKWFTSCLGGGTALVAWRLVVAKHHLDPGIFTQIQSSWTRGPKNPSKIIDFGVVNLIEADFVETFLLCMCVKRNYQSMFAMPYRCLQTMWGSWTMPKMSSLLNRVTNIFKP